MGDLSQSVLIYSSFHIFIFIFSYFILSYHSLYFFLINISILKEGSYFAIHVMTEYCHKHLYTSVI